MSTATGIAAAVGLNFEAADGRRPELITEP